MIASPFSPERSNAVRPTLKLRSVRRSPDARVLRARLAKSRLRDPFTRDSRRLKFVSGLDRFALPRVDFRERFPFAAGDSNAYDALLGVTPVPTDRSSIVRFVFACAGRVALGFA